MQKQEAKVDGRLVNLEEKVEFQEYTIEKLNEVICAQQRQLDQLEEKVRRFGDALPVGSLTAEGGDRRYRPSPPVP